MVRKTIELLDVLVVIDNFSEMGWTIPLKYKNAQTITDSFENFLITSKRKPNFFEGDRVKEFYNSTFRNFSNINNIKRFASDSLLGAVFVERFNRTIRHLPKRPVFEREDSNWIDV